jgi:NAD-dependent deacetylase
MPDDFDHESALRDIAARLRDARRVVAFTGAGISTESGIPDFRSPGGVWARYRMVYYQEFLDSADARHEYWRQKAEAHADFAAARPNAGHLALARWEAAGRLSGVVTQNIDGLHQAAGSRTVLELHGTARQIACLDCPYRADADPLVRAFQQSGHVPDCPDCGGRLKHATISFGQSLSADVLRAAAALTRQADLVLALGSSLVVEPAASLPRMARERGAVLVIVNRDPTPLDALAHVACRAPIGAALKAIDALLATA